MSNKIVKKLLASLLCVSMAVSMAACGKKEEPKKEAAPVEEAVEETAETEETVTEEVAPEELGAAVPLVFDGTRSYLTGLPLDASLVDQRPVAVMVENTKACLPHHNLDKAAIVVEAPAEGNITRYMAIFDDWANLDIIGNVRSCRTYYAEIAEEYDAIYVHWGQSPFAQPYLLADYVDDLNALTINFNGQTRPATDAAFFRYPSNVTSEHNGFTSGDAIKKGIDVRGYSMTHKAEWEPHWQFAADGTKVTLDEGEACEVIVPYYYNNEPYFIYDAASGLYKRYEFGAAEVDGESGEQYAVTNIVMEFADDVYYKEGGKDNPKGYLEFYLQSQGKGKYFTNGKMVDITWVKENYTGNTKFFMPDGSEIILNQGKTWFCLMENKYVEDNKYYATEADFH